jgi:hypothetical protein
MSATYLSLAALVPRCRRLKTLRRVTCARQQDLVAAGVLLHVRRDVVHL